MTASPGRSPESPGDGMTIAATKSGPRTATGGVPLAIGETLIDDGGPGRGREATKTHPSRRQHVLCRCGHSMTMPFCVGRRLEQYGRAA